VKEMSSQTYFRAVNVALIGISCALWVTLNLIVGHLGFTWFRLPIFCDFAVFFTLLLVSWATGKFGAVSIVEGWHIVGGITSIVITLPIIGILKKADVRRIISA
jgi:uncharacterized membrane protein